MRHNEIKKNVNEGGLGDLAQMAERDHEVQMARADLYKIAKYAIKLHEMLKTVSEAEGIEGWQQSKITKAADYIGSVYHAMDYDMKFAETAVAEAKKSSYKDGLNAMLESKTKSKVCSECGNPSWTTLGLNENELEAWDLEEEKKKGKDGKACWKGYRLQGTKKKGDRTVDNCVKVKKRKKKK